MIYKELLIRGEGAEKLVTSTRDRPRVMLQDPITINKFNVKTVEIPLTFGPLLTPYDLPFITTYTLDGGNPKHTATFTDYIIINNTETLTGDLLVDRMQEKLVIHQSASLTTLLTTPGVQLVLGAGTSGAVRLGSGPIFQLQEDEPDAGVPFLSVDDNLAVSGGGSSFVTSVRIDLIRYSLLANFFDYRYHDLPYIIADVLFLGLGFLASVGGNSMRTRPSYFLLHSNLRGGATYQSIGKPNHTTGTIIAKVNVRMDDSQSLGHAAQIWTNPCQHPDFMFSANDSEYTDLEFWMTYPDGITTVCFTGNSFSLTLCMLVRG